MKLRYSYFIFSTWKVIVKKKFDNGKRERCLNKYIYKLCLSTEHIIMRWGAGLNYCTTPNFKRIKEVILKLYHFLKMTIVETNIKSNTLLKDIMMWKVFNLYSSKFTNCVIEIKSCVIRNIWWHPKFQATYLDVWVFYKTNSTILHYYYNYYDYYYYTSTKKTI